MVAFRRIGFVTDNAPSPGGPVAAISERLLYAGIGLLPLVCWPGLEHSFSTPKIVLLAGLDAVLAVRYVLWKGPAPRRAGTADWLWLAWLASVALSALWGSQVSLEALLLVLLPAPLCRGILDGRLAPDRVRRAILAGSAVLSAVALLQFGGIDPLRWFGWQAEAFPNPRMRVYGTLGNPVFVAAWLCATLPLAAGRRGPLGWMATGLHLAAIAATGSRVFLLALPAMAVVLAVRRARRWKWLLAGVPVAIALVWLAPARPLAVTVEGRLGLARAAAGRWREIPPTGYGPGSFETQFAQAVDHAHNDYLEFLLEYGPVGLCALAALCGWLMLQAWRVGTGSAAGAWGGLAALLAVALVDFPFHRPAEWTLYWLLLGLVADGHKET